LLDRIQVLEVEKEAIKEEAERLKKENEDLKQALKIATDCISSEGKEWGKAVVVIRAERDALNTELADLSKRYGAVCHEAGEYERRFDALKSSADRLAGAIKFWLEGLKEWGPSTPGSRLEAVEKLVEEYAAIETNRDGGKGEETKC
jgi:chromosome segregation ATPase